MTLYLGSVFILLAIIGYLFFENNVTMMKSSTKYEMMYQARKISSKIIMESMKDRSSGKEKKVDRVQYLQDLNDCRFEASYYDKNKTPIYGQIGAFDNFNQQFSMQGKSCYAVMKDASNHLGVHYIVLKESDLAKKVYELRMKIIGYLLLSFLFMGVVGYFLARLFLAPVRNKIESLDKFITDTTHELNTPISAILMTVQSLKGCNDRKLKRLEASAKRLSTMYGSLTYILQDQKREEKIEPLSLPPIVEERVEYIRELILSKHLHIDLYLSALTVEIDRESAIRLVDNLLSNAIKYSDPQGSIEITTTEESLIVSDSGIGIEPSVQKDIFRRYKRANKERGGFGIGLDIVLTICKRYGIRIELESQVGKGSKFILHFPNN